MATPEEILNEYDLQVGTRRDFTLVVQTLLQQLISAGGVKPHSISCRVKDRESLAAKLRGKTTAYESLSAVTDIAGVRITTYFADDVDKIAKIILREFDVDEVNSVDRRLTIDADRFGYLSLHYIASLSTSRLALAEYARFKGLQAEIQIRSILQHAWAEMEHDLGYKSPATIPREVVRKFSMLASLLELADEQFGLIRDSLIRYKEGVAERIAAEPEAVAINRDSVRQYVLSNKAAIALDRQVALSLTGSDELEGEYGFDLAASGLLYMGIRSIEHLEKHLLMYAEHIRARAAWVAGQRKFEGLPPFEPPMTAGMSVWYAVLVAMASDGNADSIVNLYASVNLTPERGRSGAAKDLVAWYIAGCPSAYIPLDVEEPSSG